MKQAILTKGAAATDSQLEKINRFARRQLSADEVFLFSLVLCDNEVDRDDECFPAPSLYRLAELFLGKTGVFDHDPKSKNQAARIFDTEVIAEPGRNTSYGEPYCLLKAYAYMVRCPKNEELILEIDAGIKKEVSVGCSVERVRCSICGADVKKGVCIHQPGKSYEGKRCYRLLEQPNDAYEWSFVAVPAQPAAGVVKAFAQPADGLSPTDPDVWKALKSETSCIILEKRQAVQLEKELVRLRQLAKIGEKYEEELRREILSLGAVTLPGLRPELLEKSVQALDLEELSRMRESMRREKNRLLSPQIQLKTETNDPQEDNRPFQI